jgi:hypothetical protein
MDPMPTTCPACGAKIEVPVAALRSLAETCPECGASLADVARQMLESEVRIGREWDVIFIELELEKRNGIVLPEDDADAPLTLSRLIERVAAHLPQTPDRETRAAELVTAIAHETAPRLLDDFEPHTR